MFFGAFSHNAKTQTPLTTENARAIRRPATDSRPPTVLTVPEVGRGEPELPPDDEPPEEPPVVEGNDGVNVVWVLLKH